MSKKTFTEQEILYLDKNKYVKSYQDGGPNEGGLGATVVYFE